MKKFLLTLLVVIVVLGVLAGAGFAGYRFGYSNGAAASGKAQPAIPFRHMDRNLMPMHRYGDGFGRQMMPYGAPMMGRGGGFGFFSPLHLIWNVAVIALVIWFVYWLFTKSGWRITRQNGQDAPSSKTQE